MAAARRRRPRRRATQLELSLQCHGDCHIRVLKPKNCCKLVAKAAALILTPPGPTTEQAQNDPKRLYRDKIAQIHIEIYIERDKIQTKMSYFALQLEGRQLAAMDWNGYSDPYYVVHLLSPDGSRHQLYKSEKVPKCLNPEWDRHIL